MVNTVVLPLTVGITLVGLKEHVVAAGRLVRSHDNVTFEAVPAVRVATISVDPEFPGVSLTPPELERVYSKPPPCALTSATGFNTEIESTLEETARRTRSRVFCQDFEKI